MCMDISNFIGSDTYCLNMSHGGRPLSIGLLEYSTVLLHGLTFQSHLSQITVEDKEKIFH